MQLVTDKPKVVNIDSCATSIQDVVDWINANKKDESIDQLTVIMVTPQGKRKTKSFNMQYRDYAWLLTKELNEI